MNEIKTKYEMIALEALQTGLPVTIGTPTFLKVKGIAKAIGDWARTKIRPETRIIAISYSKQVKSMNAASIADVNDVKITVPRGLNGYLNAYVEALFDCYLLVENIQRDLLTPFSTWLGIMLANPDSLKEVSAVRDLKNYKTIDVDKAQKILSGFVNPNSRHESSYVKDVYPSLTTMKATWENINAMSSRYLESNPTKVLKAVKEISESINRLVEIVESREGSFSGNAATTAAKLVADMADAVDLYGQLGILIRECAVVGSRNVLELDKHLEASAKAQKAMALESLNLSDNTFTFNGRVVEHSIVVDLILQNGRLIDVPVKDLEWVVEEGLTNSIVRGDITGFENKTVPCIDYEGSLMPLENTEIIGIVVSANHASVPCVVLSPSEITEQLDKFNPYYS